MAIKELERVFYYDQMRLEDMPGLTPQQVMEEYAEIYPELAQGVVEGPDLTEEGAIYTFRKAAGVKGSNKVTVAQLAEGKTPFPFIRIAEEIDFELMSAIRDALRKDERQPLLPPSDTLGMI